MSEFTVPFEVDQVSRLTSTQRSSPIIYAHDIPWKLKVMTENSVRTGHQTFFAIFLWCNWESESTEWRVDYDSEFVILDRRQQKMKEEKISRHFQHDDLNRGIVKFILFSDLLNPANGYIHGDSVTIECRVKVKAISGMRNKVTFDYSKKLNGMNNVVLKIGNRKLNISKDLLALHSPVFATTFFGSFKEKTQRVIELSDIVYEEFVDLLNLIYPTSVEITASTVLHVLKLADRFQIESVLDRITTYFKTTKKFETAAKLKIAEQYRLHRVTNFLIKSLTKVEQFKAIKETPEYKSFSDSLTRALFERMLEL